MSERNEGANLRLGMDECLGVLSGWSLPLQPAAGPLGRAV